MDVGSLAEISVTKRLAQENWDIFVSTTGKSKLDLVAHKEPYGLISIQVKSCTALNQYGSYSVNLRSVRSNKTVNNIKLFNKNSQDILAVYFPAVDRVLFLLSSEILVSSSLNIKSSDIEEKSKIKR